MANLRPESKQPVDKSENIAVPAGIRNKYTGYQERSSGVSGTFVRVIRNGGYLHPIDLLPRSILVQPSNFSNSEYLTYLTANPFPITRRSNKKDRSGSSSPSRGFRFLWKGLLQASPFQTIPALLPKTTICMLCELWYCHKHSSQPNPLIESSSAIEGRGPMRGHTSGGGIARYVDAKAVNLGVQQ
jgi:hypothetical protein